MPKKIKVEKEKESEDYLNLSFIKSDEKSEKIIPDISDGDIDEKKESLLILSTLGMTKEYLGEELGVEKIHKLTKKNVEKYFNRYQQVQGKKVSNVLIEKGIQLGVKMISYIIPIEDSQKLERDLSQDQLVNRELSNLIGLVVLRGGRFVALASGLIQVANNVSINKGKNDDSSLSNLKMSDVVDNC